MTRERQLDGLRGLAALIVVFHHWSLVVPGVREQLDALYLTRLLVAGPQAVVVFFVLSGFVLFQAHERYAEAGILRWCGWRAVRLLVPTAVCVTVSALLAMVVAPQSVPEFTPWFNRDSWAAPISVTEWARNIAPLDGPANHQLDNATWSLVLELRYSFIFPLIALAVSRSWLVTLIVSAAGSLFMPANPGNAFDLLWMARYLPLFAAGAALSLHRDRLGALWAQHASAPRSALLLAVALAALIADPRLLLAPAPIVCEGAILLVAICAFDPFVGAILRRPAFVWLGRISFSLYLIHLPLLLAAVHALHAMMPLSAIAAATVPLTVLAAAILERWVERPAQRLARTVLHAPRRGLPLADAETGLAPV